MRILNLWRNNKLRVRSLAETYQCWPRPTTTARKVRISDHKVVNVFHHPVFKRAGNPDVIEYGEMLNIFTQAYAARMRANRHSEFCCHQNYRQDFVHAPQAASINLTKLDRVELEKLLEDHPVLALLSIRMEALHRAADFH